MAMPPFAERENGDAIDYQYDGVGRLMDEWRKTSGAALVHRNRFQYDAVGNRTQWWAQTPGDATTYNYTYNTLNQLTQRYWTKSSVSYTEDYSYDLNGNLTQKDEKTSGVLQLRWLYEWDDEDRLVSVVKQNGAGTVLLTVEYAYCPACGGNRTQKRVWNGTKTDENLVKWLQYETEGLNQLRVDERWDSNSSETITEADEWRTQRVSYNGPGQIQQLLKEVIYNYPSSTTNTVSSQTTVYYGYDRMGVVAGLSDGAGAELQQFESDAFGSWDAKSTWTTRRITGKEYDEDVQLYFFHARWYDAMTARLISVDSSAASRLQSAPSLNDEFDLGVRGIALLYREQLVPILLQQGMFPLTYAFCSDNPVAYFDPTGEWVILVRVLMGGINCPLYLWELSQVKKCWQRFNDIAKQYEQLVMDSIGRDPEYFDWVCRQKERVEDLRSECDKITDYQTMAQCFQALVPLGWKGAAKIPGTRI